MPAIARIEPALTCGRHPVLHDLSAAAIGHMLHLDAEPPLEALACEVAWIADARRSERPCALFFLHQRDQFGEIRRWQILVDDERCRHVANRRYRGEILLRIVGELFIDGRVCAERGVGRGEQKVAVARLAGGVGRADRAVGACAVLDDDRAAQTLAEMRRERAHEHVCGPAGGERHDQHDRLLRVIHRLRGLRARGERQRRRRSDEDASGKMRHRWSPLERGPCGSGSAIMDARDRRASARP
jgi:hypothetical protein